MTENNEILGRTEESVINNTAKDQYLTFTCGEEVFAAEMSLIQEIIRIPDIARVPLAPSALEGLANLRGSIVPVISLRKLFNVDSKGKGDTQRIIIINLGQPVGFIVDQVSNVVAVEKEKIEAADGISADVKRDFLKGIIKDLGGLSLIMILSFEALIDYEFSQLTVVQTQNSGTGSSYVLSPGKEKSGASQTDRQMISFSVAGQDYAVDISFAREIVQLPDSLVKMPNAPPYLLGLINLRSQLLPLINLKDLFSLDSQIVDEHSRILVLTYKDVTIGLVTDAVSEVLRVPVSQIDPVPSFISNVKNLMDISQICRLDNGNKLVSIISVEHLFEQHAIQDSINKVETMKDNTEEITSVSDDMQQDAEEQIVVFKLADDEFGVNIASVQEIVRLPGELTRIPKAPDFVEGVINLRGAVVPVIDHRKRLGLPSIERNERQRIMVFSIKGMRTGFIVDTVTEVLKIPVKSIADSPRLSNEQAKLLGRVANLEEQHRVIQLLNPDCLLEEVDRVQLEHIEDLDS